jgi:hypothetical protein
VQVGSGKGEVESGCGRKREEEDEGERTAICSRSGRGLCPGRRSVSRRLRCGATVRSLATAAGFTSRSSVTTFGRLAAVQSCEWVPPLLQVARTVAPPLRDVICGVRPGQSARETHLEVSCGAEVAVDAREARGVCLGAGVLSRGEGDTGTVATGPGAAGRPAVAGGAVRVPQPRRGGGRSKPGREAPAAPTFHWKSVEVVGDPLGTSRWAVRASARPRSTSLRSRLGPRRTSSCEHADTCEWPRCAHWV